MRRAPTFATALLAAVGAMALAGAASAQSTPGQAQGLRYLSWEGRGEITAPAERVAATPAQPRRDLRRPNPVIPHGGFAAAEPAPAGLTPAPGPARRSLTPANAWMRPAAAPPPEPQPEPQPEPMPAPPVPVVAAPQPAASPPPSGPEYLPDQGGRGQPAPAEFVQPAPPRPMEMSAAAPDPMAPRRDAPIFRMQQDRPVDAAPQPVEAAPAPARAEAPPPEPRIVSVANTGERPPQQGARYYSVHRQNGREPDALTMPTPSYVDALVVTMAETPATQDLAQPVEGPAIIRDRNGNMRAAPAASDGDHQ